MHNRNDIKNSKLPALTYARSYVIDHVERAGGRNAVKEKRSSYYAYDANGQVMATYTVTNTATIKKAQVDEHVIYGNGRLGLVQEDAQTFVFNNQVTLPNEGPYWTQKTGKKNYELTNYLGNVNAVITDRKVLDPTNPVFKAVVVATTDYYAFGMAMPGRQTNAGSYRFGYNGMELDNEMLGNGNSYTTEFRQYDPRLGRWKSLDPLMAQFPWQSPYCAFDNNPVFYTDPLGLAAEGPGDPPKGMPIDAKEGDKSIDGRWSLEDIQGDGVLDWARVGVELEEVTVYNKPSYMPESMSGLYNSIRNYNDLSQVNDNNQLNNIGLYGGVNISISGSSIYEQLNSTTVVKRSLTASTNPEYQFTPPQDMGTWGTVGSDGKYWIGCMSCHSPNGAYNYAANNSQETTTGYAIAALTNELILNNLGVGLILSSEQIAKGVGSIKIPIYRVYGGGALISGKSYTLFNPKYVPYYRNFAGLPDVNSGQYLLKGSINIRDIRVGRLFAIPYNGNTGGLPFELYQNYYQLINPTIVILKKPF